VTRVRVNFVKMIYTSVEVDVPADVAGDELERAEVALGLAYDQLPGNLCVHCVGWNQPWSVEDGDEWVTPDEFWGKDYKKSKHGAVTEEVAQDGT
jgi:hypothetical protein